MAAPQSTQLQDQIDVPAKRRCHGWQIDTISHNHKTFFDSLNTFLPGFGLAGFSGNIFYCLSFSSICCVVQSASVEHKRVHQIAQGTLLVAKLSTTLQAEDSFYVSTSFHASASVRVECQQNKLPLLDVNCKLLSEHHPSNGKRATYRDPGKSGSSSLARFDDVAPLCYSDISTIVPVPLPGTRPHNQREAPRPLLPEHWRRQNRAFARNT